MGGAFGYYWERADQRFRLARAETPIPGLVRGPYALLPDAVRTFSRKAAEQMERCLEEDPLNVAVRADLAFFCTMAELCDRATSEAVFLHSNVGGDYWFAHYALGELCAADAA